MGYDYSALKAEASKPDYAGMDSVAIASAINSKTLNVVGDVGMDIVLIWCAKYAVLPKLRSIAATAGHPLQGAADAAVMMFQGGFSKFNVANPAIAGFVAAMVASSTIAQDQANELTALATTVIPLRQTFGWSDFVTDGDVSTALGSF